MAGFPEKKCQPNPLLDGPKEQPKAESKPETKKKEEPDKPK